MKVNIGPYKDIRKVEVKIDRYDLWSLDNTLALIILPALKQLKEVKRGAPLVDDEDVPEHLRSTSAPPKENEYDTDTNHFARWEWVMQEMIWAMEQIASDDESQFYDFSEVDETENFMQEVKKVKIDYEGLKAYQDHIQNGCVLFGKYFQCLWD